MTDFSSIQQQLAAITTAQTDYVKSSFESNKAYFAKLAGATTPDKFFALTSEHTKAAVETFTAEATKIGDLYKTFAKEAFASFQPKA